MHVGSAMRKFADEMYTQMGARVLIFMGYRKEDGNFVYSSNDYNPKIDNGKSIKKSSQWKNNGITTEDFGQYLLESYGTPDKPVEEEDHVRPGTSLETNEFGEPILPDPSEPVGDTGKMKIQWYRDVVRTFVTGFYRKSVMMHPDRF
jgi:hypothetical protein